MDYIRETTDPQAVHQTDWQANEEWAATATFKKLEVLRATVENNKGVVEFKAHFSVAETPEEVQIHHEVSRFRKQAGRWYFREGKVVAE